MAWPLLLRHGTAHCKVSLSRGVGGVRVTRALSSGAGQHARILRSEAPEITFHFAMEEYLMQKAQLHGPLLYLWRPSPVVTIGRHQNPWKECKLAQMEADGVSIVRRKSGGGCVFQDPGCSVFTFIAPSAHFSIDRNLDTVIGALRRCGVSAEKKGRNDLTVDGRKISGSAFRHAPDRGVSLHHGTVLVDTDLLALQKYLTPDKRKLEAKGIASVGARVMNLKEQFADLDHDKLCEAFVEEFRGVVGAPDLEVEAITSASPMVSDDFFQSFKAKIEDADWRLGHTPEFSHQLETRIDGVGVFDVRLEVVGGKIQKAVIFSDALFPDVIDEAMRALVGVAYGRRGVGAVFDAMRPQFPEDGPRLLLDSMSAWMLENLDD